MLSVQQVEKEIAVPLPPLYESRAADILTDAQIAAVGKVAIEWGMLEFAIYAWGQAITRTFGGMAFGILTAKPSGQIMAERIHDVVAIYLLDHPAVAEIKAVLKRVKAVSEKRNDVVHGVWQITPAVLGIFEPAPKTDSPLNVTISGRGAKFDPGTPWPTAEMEKLAEDIAQVRLDLNRAMHPLPFPIGRDTSLMAPMLPLGLYACTPGPGA